MPSQKTAEKPASKTEELIEVTANRAFAVNYSKEELAKMKADDKEHRDFKGNTKLINKDESAFISKETAKKLQKAGVISINL